MVIPPEMERLILPDHTLLLGVVGSLAHGTYIPATDPDSIDDVDLMGFAFAPASVYTGLGKFEQRTVKVNEWDTVIYELKKFVHLLIKSNPNVLSLLWLNSYVKMTPQGQAWIDHRDLFSSKRAYNAFTGYAYSQLKKMTHFDYASRESAFNVEAELERRGIPLPVNKPDTQIPNFSIGWITPAIAAGRTDEELLELHRFFALKFTSGYMGKKRRELVNRFGYDTKNAAHLIRLLRMGIKFLQTGYLSVLQEDIAGELMDIKQGKWELERVQNLAQELFQSAKIANIYSPLPDEPDEATIQKLLESQIREYLCG